MNSADEMFNREREIKILEAAVEKYPGKFFISSQFDEFGGQDIVLAELQYLNEQRLITANIVIGADGFISFGDGIFITKDGIDFLKKDGGLSSVLNVVTVKFHEDFLTLLSEKISQSSDLTQPQKQKFLDQLRSLPAESTKHLVMKLVDAGLENTPKLLPLLQSLLG